MDENPSRSRRKRPLAEGDDSGKPPMQKRARFPKGKKVKPGDEKVDVWKDSDDGPSEQSNAHLAAKERAMRRHKISAELVTEENKGMLPDISAAEVHYEDNETFVDDGIHIEPFNLEKEREEGYFDEQGNFVEYVKDDEIKDAWLDSVVVDPKLAQKGLTMTNNDDDIHDLSSQQIGKMKRRIADVLQPGETVLQALRRLKGNTNRKEKMSAETKLLFDQLTEDAMKLMENGDYNVYQEEQEVFEREAEGYERLARARGEGNSVDSACEDSSSTAAHESVSNEMDFGRSSSVLDTAVAPSDLKVSTSENLPSNDDDAFDMFAEDDEKATANPTSDGSILVSDPNHDRIAQSENGASQNGYVYDESSGYYYSSSSGYYYDPSSGLYCCAASGQWYSYNEATGSYDEIQESASGASS